MSDEKRGELTLGQQHFLERMQEVQKEGVSLPDYYRAREPARHGATSAWTFPHVFPMCSPCRPEQERSIDNTMILLASPTGFEPVLPP